MAYDWPTFNATKNALKKYLTCILVAGLDIRFLRCSAWEHCEHGEAEDERSEKRSAKWYEVEMERGKFEGLSW